MTQHKLVTAAVLVIGDEILSGRTKDKNIGFIADYLTNAGIDLREVRIVADVIAEIVAALNALRARYTYVFTTGGSGRRTTTSPRMRLPPPSASRSRKIRTSSRCCSSGSNRKT